MGEFRDVVATTNTGTVREFKERLAALATLVIGQHLWVVLQQGATCCLCHCCTEARKAFLDATGLPITAAQEEVAMHRWGMGQ